MLNYNNNDNNKKIFLQNIIGQNIFHSKKS